MIVVASNDNESSQVTLPGFSICVPVPVIRFSQRLRSQRLKTAWSSLTVWQFFYEEGEGGEHYRNKNKFRCLVSRIEKRLVQLKEKIW